MDVKDNGRGLWPVILRGIDDAKLFGRESRKAQRRGMTRPESGLTAIERVQTRQRRGMMRRTRKAGAV